VTIRRSFAPMLALLLPLAAVFASTGLDEPPSVPKSAAESKASQGNLEALETTAAIEISLAPTTVIETTLPPTTASRPTTTPPLAQPAEPESESQAMPGPDNGDPADPSSWDRLAQCESGGDWSLNTRNGYYGGLQFSLSSWHAVGGSGYPHEHSRETQIEMGQRLHAQGGWRHWPACSRSFGWL